jgi:glycosyltransferase involved in cell wall biosynthesis
LASRLAIYHPSGQFNLVNNPFGKDVANLELFRALAAHGGFDQVSFLSQATITDADLRKGLLGDAPGGAALTTGSLMAQGLVAQSGVMLRGTPALSDISWLRRRAVGDRAYSLMGLVHTLAPPALRAEMATALTSPIQPWDALICTSPSVQDALHRMFDEWSGFLADRFGGAANPKPYLPLIPLGVDQPAIQARADRPQVRAQLREELAVGEDDILVLWLGRLSFFEKAAPQPMFRAIEEAARTAGVKVHFAMVGWFPNGDQDRVRYQAAAQAYAPSVTVHFLDGNDQGRVGSFWAGSDIFISLVDNIQETFGITPVEAMAAGLPVVVSDWDGYRYTVQDGEQGFLIPTLGGPPGGVSVAAAERHVLGLDSYQLYVGGLAQHTAVHVGRAAGGHRRPDRLAGPAPQDGGGGPPARARGVRLARGGPPVRRPGRRTDRDPRGLAAGHHPGPVQSGEGRSEPRLRGLPHRGPGPGDPAPRPSGRHDGRYRPRHGAGAGPLRRVVALHRAGMRAGARHPGGREPLGEGRPAGLPHRAPPRGSDGPDVDVQARHAGLAIGPGP